MENDYVSAEADEGYSGRRCNVMRTKEKNDDAEDDFDDEADDGYNGDGYCGQSCERDDDDDTI